MSKPSMTRASDRAWLWLLCLLGAGSLLSSCRTETTPRYVPATDHATQPPRTGPEQVALADRLVADNPDDLDALNGARSLLERAEKGQQDGFTVRWKLARVCFLMAQRLKNRQQRIDTAQEGIASARSAVALDGSRVEPHYYLALNMAQIAEADSRLSLVKPMVAAAQRAAEITPAFDGAGPLVFLGKVYLTAPAWPVSVGNAEKAITLLERALELAPRALTRLFLGQAYYEDDREEEARAQLERALGEARPGELEPRWRQEAKKTLNALE